MRFDYVDNGYNMWYNMITIHTSETCKPPIETLTEFPSSCKDGAEVVEPTQVIKHKN